MEHKSGPYGRLGLMVLLSFVAMYVLMYAMVDRFANIFNSINQAYMAALMAAPMVVIELLVSSRAMYHNATLNALFIAASVVTGFVLFMFIQRQTAVGHRQFLRSMIPHHSSAILMCGKASVQDPEIRQLCQSIISGQQREIDQMNMMLRRLRSTP